ncbi:MAG: PQQ-dependent sugar dehydrogenase [Anaerolineaceae bacterium]
MISIKKACFFFFVALFCIVYTACQSVGIGTTGSATQDTVGEGVQTETATYTPLATKSSVENVDWKIEVVADNLYVPWSILFTSEKRMLVSERNGAIREVLNDILQSDPIYQFSDVAAFDEAGLMGLALDPGYQENNFIYACYTYQENDALFNRVVRLVDAPDQMVLDGIVIERIPSAHYHAGCRLRFAADGTLYITTGDALQPESAQDPTSLAGKILRLNPDGSIPDDNPIQDSPVYSLGHRNPQGLDWDPRNGLLYATEHGPSGSDGLAGGDEINLIEAGGNYGWPLVSHEEHADGLISPLIVFTPAEAPASGMFYRGIVFPQYQNDFFFGALRGEGLMKVVISADDPRVIQNVEKIITSVGRVREVVEGPDGFIYFSTSNRDGRGTVKLDDDKIYRLIPQ